MELKGLLQDEGKKGVDQRQGRNEQRECEKGWEKSQGIRPSFMFANLPP